MNFEHSAERRMLGDSLNRFIAQHYNLEKRQQSLQSSQGFNSGIWQQLAEMGVIGALFSEADGGYGGGGFDLALVFEAVGRGLLVEPLLGSAVLAGDAIASAGSETQKIELAQIIDGSLIAALAHDEPDSHYELNRVACRAEPQADGWRLDGTKSLVLHGEQAGLLVVSARTAGAIDDSQGISLFLVPRDTPGLEIRGSATLDGGPVAQVRLNQLLVPDSALLGTLHQGHATLERAIGRGVLALCAEALGAMEVAKVATLDYLRTRQQFGRPIGSFQALQHRMAVLLLEIEQARSAVINAASALEADRLDRERALSAAKVSIGRIATLVAQECIQLHGGIGMTWELPLAHYAKRLVMIDHQLGDEDHHLQRYIALGKQ
ncbi:acyl-CoA dehydrogenase family protein [Pseudomonas protegens]|uniref:acyl-CoA dehydrogenase family protein n=1 Tax=Pseudomonas protegens TaxID=380021 RepID=UPI001B30BDA9|nr:acyl-CoA dehydrogenase family protein [Pseudomonas protegens]MBP5098224.1 acyl-CoA dehydrogenase family protein [Pseudomonas protegens]QTU05531.1 acyl-CoA dehydrogenase family protein [Pseudomonas protegens]QTU11842.1 acyl-CoA dehydrogenase family protein [Pseudomonas protegens]QTU40780.1 acyl-CoA dehydrogenase family protein [Pseudomonas protegens]